MAGQGGCHGEGEGELRHRVGLSSQTASSWMGYFLRRLAAVMRGGSMRPLAPGWQEISVIRSIEPHHVPWPPPLGQLSPR